MPDGGLLARWRERQVRDRNVDEGDQAIRREAQQLRARVLAELADERVRQDAKWGEQNHPDGTGGTTAIAIAIEARRACQRAAAAGRTTWSAVLLEEVWEALAEERPAAIRAELVQVAAVAVAWIEAIDRRSRPDPDWPTLVTDRGQATTTPPETAGGEQA